MELSYEPFQIQINQPDQPEEAYDQWMKMCC